MTSGPQLAITQTLAEFALLPATDLPAPARHAARRAIANTVGLAVGASRHPAYESAYQALTAPRTKPQASLLGRGERASTTVAALLTGLGAHVDDFDDTHLTTVIHPGAPVVPAALAVAEHIGASFDAVVDAVTYGIEVTLRIGVGLGTAHFDRGWHLTSTTGRFGAAVAAGRLLCLDTDQMVVALGVAAAEAAGLQEALGTMTKSLHPGKAAADGIEAALLASFGYTGPLHPIEGRRGLALTAAPHPDLSAIVARLGEVWEIQNNAIKPYACGVVSHPVIDAAIALRARARPNAIASISLRTHPVVLDVMGVADPLTGLQSKFSVYHCFAVGLLYGAGGPAQFADSTAREPAVISLRKSVSVVLDPSVAKDECFATVRLVDGQALTHHVKHATASAASPMTDQQLTEKVRLVAGPVLGDDQAQALASAVLSGATSLDGLLALATPDQQQATERQQA